MASDSTLWLRMASCELGEVAVLDSQDFEETLCGVDILYRQCQERNLSPKAFSHILLVCDVPSHIPETHKPIETVIAARYKSIRDGKHGLIAQGLDKLRGLGRADVLQGFVQITEKAGYSPQRAGRLDMTDDSNLRRDGICRGGEQTPK